MAARPLGEAEDAVGQDETAGVVEPLDLDQVGDEPGDSGLDGGHLPGEVGVDANSLAEQEPELVTLLVDEAEVGGEAELDLLPGRAGPARRLVDDLRQPGPHLPEQLEEEVALRGEVLVEHRLGDPGFGGHRVHRGGLEPVGREDGEGCRQQLFTAFGGGQADLHGRDPSARRVTRDPDRARCRRGSPP